MANVLILQLNANPTNFDFIGIQIYRGDGSDGYYYLIGKQFTTNTVSSIDQVRIGATILETLQNLVLNLVEFNSDSNVNLSVEYSIIPELNQVYFEFLDAANYNYENVLGEFTAAVDYTVFLASSSGPLYPSPLPFLLVKDFSISIIDTYTNSRPMIIEQASAGACEISWDGGDDLIAEVMSSELKFNMLVPDFSDAHFLHLFTGDENRFRVELNAIDGEENAQLVWAGFLLPDQYKERYTNNNLFVYFVATDNVGVLKGKYFPDWYYYNAFPIAELFSMILEMTGLQQGMLIRPSIVPNAAGVRWMDINVPLNVYKKDTKKDDVYKILQDVLKANLLTLKNYRGFWVIEGLTRKKDEAGVQLQFDLKGRFIGQSAFTKRKITPLMRSESPNISVKTPYKKVTFDVKVNGDKNMFRDDVWGIEQKDIFKIGFGPGSPDQVIYIDKDFLDWENNFSSAVGLSGYFGKRLSYRSNSGWYYNVNEAQALVSYVQCPDTVFVKPGVLYAFEMEFFAQQLISSDSQTTGEVYNRWIPFQFFLNGDEIMSNRPSFPESSLYSWTVVNDVIGTGTYGTRFKISHEFRVKEAGELSLRILAPIVEYGDWTFINMNRLQVKIVEDYGATENISAVRDINYTTELNYSVNFTCSQDKSVENSLGLVYPVNANYIRSIRSSNNPIEFYSATNYYQVGYTVQIDVASLDINYFMYELLFKKGFKKACFVKMLDGSERAFDNLFGRRSLTIDKKAAWLTGFEGYPIMPKNYFAFTETANLQGIYVMWVNYGAEDYTKRLKWRVYDSETELEFRKALVNAVHSTVPEQLFVLETELLQICLPEDVVAFDFANEVRDFIPTRISIDLYGGTTTIVSTELKYKEFTDLKYE
jgi:hypothetical protein